MVPISKRREGYHRDDAGELDITGWDLKKALKLLWKSNGSMLERIQSPMIYHAEEGFVKGIQELADKSFSQKSGLYHYLGLAKRSYDSVEGQEMYKLKAMFYALRGTLACQWIIEKGSIPPIEFDKMVEGLSFKQELKERIRELVKMKSSVNENYLHNAEKELMDYIKNM